MSDYGIEVAALTQRTHYGIGVAACTDTGVRAAACTDTGVGAAPRYPLGTTLTGWLPGTSYSTPGTPSLSPAVTARSAR